MPGLGAGSRCLKWDFDIGQGGFKCTGTHTHCLVTCQEEKNCTKKAKFGTYVKMCIFVKENVYVILWKKQTDLPSAVNKRPTVYSSVNN